MVDYAHNFLVYQVFFAIFTRADKSYDTYPYQERNYNTCCQYNGCIGGHVTLSLRRWELTYDVNFQYGRVNI